LSRAAQAAISTQKAKRVDEGGLVEQLSKRLGFDFAEAIKTRIADPDADISKFGSQFEVLANDLGLNSKALEAIAQRSGLVNSEEDFNKVLVSALAGELLDKTNGGEGSADLKTALSEILSPGTLAAEINAAREAASNDEKGKLEQALSNVMNDPLARQIAAMERIVSVNEGQFEKEGVFGNLTAEALVVAKENLEQLKAQYSLQQGEKERLDAIKEGLITDDRDPNVLISAGIDHLLVQQEKTSAAIAAAGQQTADANKPVVDAAKKTANFMQQFNAKMDSLFNATSAHKQEQAAQHTQNTIQRKKLAEAQQAKLIIDEASREDFINSFKEKFDEACQLWVTQFSAALSEGQLDVNVAPMELELNAKIESIIKGEEFAEQLVQALIGTGLEDQVEVIAETVSKLVQTEIDRGGSASLVHFLDSPRTGKPNKARVRGSNLT